VVVGQADQSSLGGGTGGVGGGGVDGVGTGVLDLLNQVLVTLLGEAAALLGVQVHVVAPHLKGGLEEVAKQSGQVEVQANLVVLQSNQWQIQTWVAVEEEQQWQIDTDVVGRQTGDVQIGGGGVLAPLVLVLLRQEHLGVQTPPSLVVLVDTLTTDGQFQILNGTLGDPVVIWDGVVGGLVHTGRQWCQGHIHVTDQVTVAGNGYGNAIAGCNRAVDGLDDVLHRKVGVALVNRLEEGHLGLTSQVNILSTVSNQLH